MARRSASGQAQRDKFFKQSFELNLDSDGEIQVKVHPLFEHELRKILKDIADRAREDVLRTHFKTGKLAASIRPDPIIRKQGAHRILGTVSAGGRDAYYAKYVHNGTRAHIIRAKPGGWLAFDWPAARRAQHPTRSHFKVEYPRLLTKDEVEFLSPRGQGRARLYRQKRIAWEKANKRKMRIKYYQPDTTVEEKTYPYAERVGKQRMIVKQVHHPGYKGDRFLVQAAAEVVGGHKVPGRINVARRRV